MKSKDALTILSEGQPLVGVNIDDTLDFKVWGTEIYIEQPIVLDDCVVTSIEAPFLYFKRPVIIENTKVLNNASFYAGYFFQGLKISGCHFLGGLDLQCGGHNKCENAIILDKTRFDGFVNFFDCWYEGPFIVKDCRFSKGTNLLGNKGQPYQVQFDVPVVIESTTGELGLNSD